MKNKTGNIRVWIAILSLLATLATPLTSHASDAESMQNLRLLILLVKMQSNNVECRNKASGEYLSRDDSYTVRTTLYSGNNYILLGAGDSSVRDLDIILYDENWREIDRDTKTDSKPIVLVSPRWSGTFYIKVKMYRGNGYSNIAICYK